MIKEHPNEAVKEWTEEYEKNLGVGALGAFYSLVLLASNGIQLQLKKQNKTKELIEKPLDNLGNYWEILKRRLRSTEWGSDAGEAPNLYRTKAQNSNCCKEGRH